MTSSDVSSTVISYLFDYHDGNPLRVGGQDKQFNIYLISELLTMYFFLKMINLKTYHQAGH